MIRVPPAKVISSRVIAEPRFTASCTDRRQDSSRAAASTVLRMTDSTLFTSWALPAARTVRDSRFAESIARHSTATRTLTPENAAFTSPDRDPSSNGEPRATTRPPDGNAASVTQ